jgi:hypothetical protein
MILVGGLVLTMPTVVHVRADDGKQDAKDAGNEAKDAAKDAGKAAKDTGKAVAKGTKHAAKKTKRALTPDTTSAMCKDGTVQQGKTKTTACDDHGGKQDKQ